MNKTVAKKLNASTKDSIAIYGAGLRECLEVQGVVEKDWDEVWSFDDAAIEADGDMQFLIGWFTGVSESLGIPQEKLITLAPPVKKPAAKKKKAPAKKKAPVKKPAAKKKKAPAKKKAPVKTPAKRKKKATA